MDHIVYGVLDFQNKVTQYSLDMQSHHIQSYMRYCENKANSALLELRLGLSLAIAIIDLLHSCDFVSFLCQTMGFCQYMAIALLLLNHQPFISFLNLNKI